MFDTWLRTVFGLRYSARAISGFVQPSATSASTSRSRCRQLWERDVHVRLRPRGVEVADDAAGDVRSEDRFAVRHRSHRPFDVLVVGALQQVTTSAGAHCSKDRLVVLGHRDHEDTDVRRSGNDLPRCLDAIELRHVQSP